MCVCKSHKHVVVYQRIYIHIYVLFLFSIRRAKLEVYTGMILLISLYDRNEGFIQDSSGICENTMGHNRRERERECEGE